ncbi:MAG: glycerol-3-phosphate dehydrogenase [Methyloceanibacter sp.]|uniref:glycerol-3-phosphate dehydrogenase n=1 Tax=Methyloceanibacter sp. TaxID=1965321 RepID=UPI003D6D5FCD
MATDSFDLLVIGGGIHGAAVARDAAGRGLKVMLAEKGDYACATSSASSKLIHGGLRYLERLEFKLVRESLLARAELLDTAPHLVWPMRFLMPVYGWQKRQAWMLQAGLALYDVLSFGGHLPASGRLSAAETTRLPRLRKDDLAAVFRYPDCQADDARLTLSVVLDARARGADILNRRAVTAITALDNGYAVELDERGAKRRVEARFIVNAAGPFVAGVDGLTAAAPPPRPLRLVRGSHIVLPMPDPPEADAYTLQDEDERIVFVIPWLDGRFLIVGTTDVPHAGDPSEARCSPEEMTYLLDAYNRYFASGGPVTAKDVVFTFSGVRALHDETGEKPSRISRSPALAVAARGTGGFVTLYGGKLTTHRAIAEDVLHAIKSLGVAMGPAWTKGMPLYGGNLSRAALFARAERGPAGLSSTTRRRLVLTYGDRIETLFAHVVAEPAAAQEIAPGVTRAELEYAVETEDAMTAEDFLLRRTKLHLLLDQAGRDAVAQWFGKA